jgi:hypothetical protein
MSTHGKLEVSLGSDSPRCAHQPFIATARLSRSMSYLCERVMNTLWLDVEGLGARMLSVCVLMEKKPNMSVVKAPAQPYRSGWYIDHSCRAGRAMVAPCDMSAVIHMSPITQWTTSVGRMIDGMSLNDQVIAWIGYVLLDRRRSDDCVDRAISASPLLDIRFWSHNDVICS